VYLSYARKRCAVLRLLLQRNLMLFGQDAVMRMRPLGSDGPEVSVVGLGCNNFGGRLGLEETAGVVDAALEAGITLFDTADIYGNGGGSEELLGQVLEGRRDRVLLATKFGGDMGDGTKARGSRSYIHKAIDASLRRLRTNYVDLYQYHTPDGITPYEETFGALDELVHEGKVRYVGHSNLRPRDVEEVDAMTRRRGLTRPVSAQNQYSLLRREAEDELLPTCERLGIGVLPYFPLASGLLTGKYKRSEPRPEGTRLSGREEVFTDETFDRLERLERFAAERGVQLLDVAIGALLAQPAIASVIAGATKAEQVRANAAAGEWEPRPDDLAALNEIR
jgi:aryl-alcohol dehydrogenase-like predicted oxidoreductase